MTKVVCKNKCGFEDEFEPCDLGLTYFQAIGICPLCDTSPTVYEDGEDTLVFIEFKLIDTSEK